MKRTLRLKVVGFANDCLHLEQSTGELLMVPVDWFDHAALLSIEKFLTPDVENWNNHDTMQVYVIADVDIRSTTGATHFIAFKKLETA